MRDAHSSYLSQAKAALQQPRVTFRHSVRLIFCLPWTTASLTVPSHSNSLANLMSGWQIHLLLQPMNMKRKIAQRQSQAAMLYGPAKQTTNGQLYNYRSEMLLWSHLSHEKIMKMEVVHHYCVDPKHFSVLDPGFSDTKRWWISTTLLTKASSPLISTVPPPRRSFDFGQERVC